MIQDKINPLKLYEYFKTKDLLEQEVGNFLRNKFKSRSLQDKYSNDLRHQYASAVFTQKYGSKVAKTLGDWNELFGASGNEDSEIDQINNEIGRNYGLKYPNMTKIEILNKLFEDHEKNVEIRKSKMKKGVLTGSAASISYDKNDPFIQGFDTKRFTNTAYPTFIAINGKAPTEQQHREILEGLSSPKKQTKNNKSNENGYWFTTKSGKHIFVPES